MTAGNEAYSRWPGGSPDSSFRSMVDLQTPQIPMMPFLVNAFLTLQALR